MGLLKYELRGFPRGVGLAAEVAAFYLKTRGFIFVEGFTCAGLGGAGANCLLPQDPGVKSAGVTGLLAQPQEQELLELQYFFT